MKHCLVVDDSSVIRKVARRILEDMDFTITEAENGQEAFERCRSDMPDMVLLDWDMPVMGATEFLSAIRLNNPGEKVPKVIYCTTENDTVDITRALNMGADDYLLKPFDRASLEAKIADVGMA